MSRRTIGILVVVVAVLAAALVFWQRSARESSHGSAGAVVDAGGVAKKAPAPPKLTVTDGEPEQAAPALSEVVLDDDPAGTLRLEGQVIDRDKLPVAGAVVTLSSNPPRTIETEADGSFAFDGLMPRTYLLRAHKGELVGGPVAHRLTDTSDPAIVRVAPGASIRVTVVDEAGAAIAGAALELRQGSVRSETTDQDGRARFAGVHSGPGVVVANAPGFAVTHHPVLVPGTAGAVIDERIVMARGVSISGVVVSDKGKPVAGARVVAHSASALVAFADLGLDGVVTGKSGEFVLPPQAAGTYRLTAVHANFAPGNSDPVMVDGAAPVSDVRIVVKAGGIISGRVVDSSEQPVPFAEVRVMAQQGMGFGWVNGPGVRRVMADAGGAFRITGLARADLSVMAVSRAAASEIFPVDTRKTPAREGLVLVLGVTGTIAGTVVDSTGAPVAEAQVTALPDFWDGASVENFLLRGMLDEITDGSGKFVFAGLPQGSYRLRALRAGTSSMQWVQPGVRARTGDGNVTLVLDEPGGITGAVQFADGGAPGAFTVTVGIPPGMPVVDERGRFTIGDLPAGKYDVTFRGQEFAPRTVRDVEIIPGQTRDLGTISVKRGRQVSGRVVDAGKNPVAGAVIITARQLVGDGRTVTTAMGQGADELFGVRRATSQADGSFVLSGVGPGEVQLIAEHEERGRTFPQTIPAGTNSVVVTLELRGFGSVSGAVTVGGAPASAVAVLASPRGGGNQMLAVRTGQDGRYVFERLAEGSYRVTATVTGQNLVSATLTGKDVEVIAGRAAQVDIDVAVGDITLTVAIAGKNGAVIDAAQVFLIPGQVSPQNAKELTELALRQASGGIRQTLAMGTGSAQFQQVASGEYSVCTIPINGNMADPSFQMRLQEHTDQLKVYCQPVTIAATPREQTHTAEVPPMEPLPAEPSEDSQPQNDAPNSPATP